MTIGDEPTWLVSFVYTHCLYQELARAGIPSETQVPIPVIYKDSAIPLGFRADIVVDNAVIVAIKSAAALIPAHEAQVLTHLRMSEFRVALLMNFGARLLKDGLKRFIV